MIKTHVRSLSVVMATAGALTLGAAAVPMQFDPEPAPVPAIDSSAVTLGADTDNLGEQVADLRSHLQSQPADARSWAVLSLLLIEQGRVTADPSSYTEADAAIASSFDAQPRGNDLALAARAALLSAQHRFLAGLHAARQALSVDPYSLPALGVQVDALTELGRLPAADRAARQFDQVRPSLAATTRLAYQAELRGHDRAAARYFRDARSDAAAASALAFVEVHLGDLARRAGDLAAAAQHCRSALEALPGDPAATAGLARVLAVRGDVQRSIRLLRSLVDEVPMAEHVISLGELYLLIGDRMAAREQFDVVRASAALARANGVRPDLELAWFEADHGSPHKALQLARSEWQRRQPPMVADAWAWALHVNGKDAAALRYAKLATAYGGDARAWHHRGLIEASVGLAEKARSHLRKALSLDAGYSPWQARQVDQALRRIEESS